MRKTLITVYLVMGCVICIWFTVAAAYRWKSPDFGVVKSIGTSGGVYGRPSGRSYGGSWGGGK